MVWMKTPSNQNAPYPTFKDWRHYLLLRLNNGCKKLSFVCSLDFLEKVWWQNIQHFDCFCHIFVSIKSHDLMYQRNYPFIILAPPGSCLGIKIFVMKTSNIQVMESFKNVLIWLAMIGLRCWNLDSVRSKF